MNHDWDSQDPLTQDEPGDEGMPQQMTMDMISGGAGGSLEDFAPPKKNGSSGMLVLLLAVVVGGGSLWAMRMAGPGEPVETAGSEAEKKIEAALARLSSDDADNPQQATRHALDVLFRDTDEVIAMFADDPTQNQVALEELQKDPFELMVSSDDEEDGESDAKPMDDAERERQERLAELENEHGRLTLQSVLTGNPSVAVINDKVVQQGGQVGSFKVISIGRQGVRLSAEGETYTLELAEPDDGGNALR